MRVAHGDQLVDGSRCAERRDNYVSGKRHPGEGGHRGGARGERGTVMHPSYSAAAMHLRRRNIQPAGRPKPLVHGVGHAHVDRISTSPNRRRVEARSAPTVGSHPTQRTRMPYARRAGTRARAQAARPDGSPQDAHEGSGEPPNMAVGATGSSRVGDVTCALRRNASSTLHRRSPSTAAVFQGAATSEARTSPWTLKTLAMPISAR